jgi:hypothetical protein
MCRGRNVKTESVARERAQETENEEEKKSERGTLSARRARGLETREKRREDRSRESRVLVEDRDHRDEN